MRKILILILLLSACSTVRENEPKQMPENYQESIETWRSDYEKKLTSPDGWLSLTGLYWLDQPISSIGNSFEYDVTLPLGGEPRKLGTISLEDSTIAFTSEPNTNFMVEGKPITKANIEPDISENPTVIKSGSVEFLVIKRNEKFGVRVRNSNNPARKNFKGVEWFPIDYQYAIEGRFEEFESPKEVLIPNVLGQNVSMKSPGIVKFRIAGEEVALQPVESGDGRLFFIFRDLSSKESTYGGGRFLYSDLPKNGKINIDFNKAENPPCAYTSFATCPLPPSQNQLRVEINAGEKRYEKPTN